MSGDDAESARRLGTLLGQHVRAHFRPPGSGGEAPNGPPPSGNRYRVIIAYLRWIPGLLVALFVTSLFWDFPGWTLTLAGYALEVEGLLRSVSVAGLIGFGTNWLAILMLFRPRTPRPILGQGLLPAQRERMAHRMSRTISNELLSESLIEERLTERGLVEQYREKAARAAEDALADERIRKEIRRLIADRIDRVLADSTVRQRLTETVMNGLEAESRSGLSGLALRAYRYFNEGELTDQIHDGIDRLAQEKAPLLAEIDRRLDRIPAWLENRADAIETGTVRSIVHVVRHLDIEQIVRENLLEFDERELERVLLTTSDEQLNYIKYLGGLLGCVGGLLIWQPVLAVALLGSLGSLILLADELWLRLESRS